MQIERADNTNFKGIFVTTGKFSTKPKQCLMKTRDAIEKLITPEPFDLHVKQDYGTNEIVFCTNKKNAEKRISVLSKASKYINSAKETIGEHYYTQNRDLQILAKQQKNKMLKQEITDTLETIFLFPLFIVNDILH